MSNDVTVHRCGLLMAARALKTGAATGLVVTASHNPATDNGVKLVEPTGYMLDQSWEVRSPQYPIIISSHDSVTVDGHASCSGCAAQRYKNLPNSLKRYALDTIRSRVLQ